MARQIAVQTDDLNEVLPGWKDWLGGAACEWTEVGRGIYYHDPTGHIFRWRPGQLTGTLLEPGE